jgi:hypothetical protein
MFNGAILEYDANTLRPAALIAPATDSDIEPAAPRMTLHDFATATRGR